MFRLKVVFADSNFIQVTGRFTCPLFVQSVLLYGTPHIMTLCLIWVNVSKNYGSDEVVIYGQKVLAITNDRTSYGTSGVLLHNDDDVWPRIS